MSKPIKQFDTEEVCIWLTALGLGSSIDKFKSEGVDGGLLCDLSADDLTGDLGLSGLQSKKVLRAIEAEKASAPDTSRDARIAQLEAENESLRHQIAQLKHKIEASQGSQKPKPAPAPAPAPAPPPQQTHHSQQQHYHEPGLVGGAARGAAGGAVKGAIVGAILPGMSAANGAAAGAAVGATTGGLRAAGRRRGHRMDYL